MKTFFTIATILVLLTGCSKDSASGYNSQLPPETQIGANTFGVTINGKVYVPRDPKGGNGVNPSSKGMTFWGAPDNVSWNEVEVKDGASAVGFQIYLHMQNFPSFNMPGKLTLSQSNFHNSVDSTPFHHIYFKIWDQNITNYAYYGSIENLGEINITRHINGIVSGNFKGKFVRYDNPNDFITITDGRFDINTQTLPNAVFP
ncbi:MAG: hypothetical protein WCJ62_01590 [Flavobacterium sp.]